MFSIANPTETSSSSVSNGTLGRCDDEAEVTAEIPSFLQSSRDAMAKTRMQNYRGKLIPSGASLDSVVTDDAIVFFKLSLGRSFVSSL